MTWETDNEITRDEAKSRIIELAKNEGITGAFKVFYKNELISTPEDLPERVNMGDIKVSSVLDQS